MTMTVVPDALPAVRLVSPGRDLVFAGGNPRLVFEAHGQDDFGLRSMSLRFTRVSGSGEQFDFKEGDIPLTIERSSATAWTGSGHAGPPGFRIWRKETCSCIGPWRPTPGQARTKASSDVYFIEDVTAGCRSGRRVHAA